MAKLAESKKADGLFLAEPYFNFILSLSTSIKNLYLSGEENRR